MFISTAFSHGCPRPSVQTKWVVSILTVSMILAPILSTAVERLSFNGAGRMPGVMVIPDKSVILCVLTANFSLPYVPADVRKTRWKVYSVSTANPLIFVLCISAGRGILPALLPFRYRLKERN